MKTKIPPEPASEGRGKPQGAGVLFDCFECDGGVYVPCDRPTCHVCGAQPPTMVRKAIRELSNAA